MRRFFVDQALQLNLSKLMAQADPAQQVQELSYDAKLFLDGDVNVRIVRRGPAQATGKVQFTVADGEVISGFFEVASQPSAVGVAPSSIRKIRHYWCWTANSRRNQSSPWPSSRKASESRGYLARSHRKLAATATPSTTLACRACLPISILHTAGQLLEQRLIEPGVREHGTPSLRTQ